MKSRHLTGVHRPHANLGSTLSGHSTWRTLLTAVIIFVAAFGLRTAGLAASSKAEAEVVVLRKGGFFPQKIVRPKGEFLLVIKNRSGATTMTLNVTHSDNTPGTPGNRTNRFDQDLLLDLPSGTHIVSDADHPQWSHLMIVIQ